MHLTAKDAAMPINFAGKATPAITRGPISHASFDTHGMVSHHGVFLQVFLNVTLPNIRVGLLYGIVLTNAVRTTWREVAFRQTRHHEMSHRHVQYPNGLTLLNTKS